MALTLYGLKNCDTCRKALKVCRAFDGETKFVDVRADGITRNDLERFQGAFGAALLNTRSTTWRGLDDAERARDPIDLLIAHPALMKRPVIDHDGVLSLGWGGDVAAKFTA